MANKENKDFIKSIILGFILLGTCFFFPGILRIASRVEGTLIGIFNFFIGPFTFFLSAMIVYGPVFIKTMLYPIKNLFSKGEISLNPPAPKKLPKSFGWSAIPTTTIIFAFAGLLASLFAGQFSISIIFSYAIVGFIWGIIIYILFQKKFVDFHDHSDTAF